jgi:hypothetical protein
MNTYGLGFDQSQRNLPVGPELAQEDPEGTVPIAKSGFIDLPLRHQDLLA